ncbi:hypothetical protein GCM10011534_08700 [Pseudooceanicola nanhaiensis]|uniref:Uncharacterized protein n=1 Tax=Pseudooceanicola nanhaiensis TaxID=375761 RepID=A0A917SNC4_9RHOB|nr:hypothetical protein GCM10011534_08700 [Pseudooceanicola nanhaiensis]
MYCSGRTVCGTSGSTTLSTHPASVQSSQIVRPMGMMTTIPVRKLDRRREKIVGLRRGSWRGFVIAPLAEGGSR